MSASVSVSVSGVTQAQGTREVNVGTQHKKQLNV